MPIIKQCLFCGKDFKTDPHRVRRGEGKYCSHSCSFKMHHKLVPAFGNNNHNWKGYKSICKGCGKKFHVAKCQEKFIRYCSKDCKKKNRKITSSLSQLIRTSYRYLQWRSEVFNRDKWTCQTCQKNGIPLHAHHMDKLSLLLENNSIKDFDSALLCEELWDLNNGVTLCVNCHKLTNNYGRQK